jgi:anti-sigma factor RsiW
MNTNPDETRLAMWLDDELTGADLAEMEAWAATRPEQLAAREDVRSFRKMMAANLPASEEPPYPDFFLSRVNQVIRELQRDEVPAKHATRAPFWKSWMMPAAACAGMVLAFGVGKRSGDAPGALTVVPSVSPVVYTPEEGVDAEWFSSTGAGASVIVLQGVSAIPDSTDFSETVYVPTAREGARTATREKENKDAAQQ